MSRHEFFSLPHGGLQPGRYGFDHEDVVDAATGQYVFNDDLFAQQSTEVPLLPKIITRDDFLPYLTGLGRSEIGAIMETYDDIVLAYRDSKRRNGDPAVIHPITTAAILLDHGINDTTTIRIALLHDTVEDTPDMYNIDETVNVRRRKQARSEITKTYGAAVAKGVLILTKPYMDGRRVRSEEDVDEIYYRQLRAVLKTNPNIIWVKIADRIHNLYTMEDDDTERKNKQARETVDMYLQLFSDSLYALGEQGSHLMDLLVDGLVKLDVPLDSEAKIV